MSISCMRRSSEETGLAISAGETISPGGWRPCGGPLAGTIDRAPVWPIAFACGRGAVGRQAGANGILDAARGEVAEPGLRRTPGERVNSKGFRGFKSPPLRQLVSCLVNIYSLARDGMPLNDHIFE